VAQPVGWLLVRQDREAPSFVTSQEGLAALSQAWLLAGWVGNQAVQWVLTKAEAQAASHEAGAPETLP